MDMIERVARAICIGAPGAPQRKLVVTDMGSLGTVATFSEETAPSWRGYVGTAHVAIEAMRQVFDLQDIPSDETADCQRWALNILDAALTSSDESRGSS